MRQGRASGAAAGLPCVRACVLYGPAALLSRSSPFWRGPEPCACMRTCAQAFWGELKGVDRDNEVNRHVRAPCAAPLRARSPAQGPACAHTCWAWLRQHACAACVPCPPAHAPARARRILWAFKLNPYERLDLPFTATHEEVRRQVRARRGGRHVLGTSFGGQLQARSACARPTPRAAELHAHGHVRGPCGARAQTLACMHGCARPRTPTLRQRARTRTRGHARPRTPTPTRPHATLHAPTRTAARAHTRPPAVPQAVPHGAPGQVQPPASGRGLRP